MMATQVAKHHETFRRHLMLQRNLEHVEAPKSQSATFEPGRGGDSKSRVPALFLPKPMRFNMSLVSGMNEFVLNSSSKSGLFVCLLPYGLADGFTCASPRVPSAASLHSSCDNASSFPGRTPRPRHIRNKSGIDRSHRLLVPRRGNLDGSRRN